MQDNQHAYSVSTHTDCSSTLHPLCLPHTFQISDWKPNGRYYLYEIGFVTVAGGWSMTWFQGKLNLWIWCSGVWPMNCFGRNRCHFGCFTLGWSGSGSEIRDHADHGRSNELMNFCPEWSHQCIWSTMIQVISDHLSWSRTSQRNPLLIYTTQEICKHRTGQPINQ